MISPRFATLLVLRADRRRDVRRDADLLLGVTVKRSFDRISVDGQLSTSDTVFLHCSGASGVTVEPETEDELRFGEALDAVLRQLALRGRPRRRGRAPRRARRRARRRRSDGVERVARAIANSPLVKTALYGGDPNWGRIIQAVGVALPGSAPLDLDIAIEGVRSCARGGVRRRTTPAALEAAVQGDEVEYEIVLPGEGGGDRAVLLRPRPRVRDDQRRLHDVTELSDARHRHPARGAAVHPRVPRQDGRDQVRRRGDDRPAAEGGVRARRRAAQVRRHEPGVVHGGGPEITALHGAARPARAVRRRPARVRRGRPSRSRRWCSSARSTRTSCC